MLIIYFQEKLKESEWLDLNVFMNFNKLAGMLLAAFERVDAEDLFTALSALPSDLLEVRKIGKNLLQDIPLVKTLGSSYYLVVFTILRSTLAHKKYIKKV